MDWRQLQCFVRVAECRHFTRAAESLHLAQPSLSQQIARLERELGFAVFERGPAGARLTSEGEQFLPHARAALERLRDAETAANDIRGVARGQVTLGMSPIAGARVLPVLLRAINAAYPALTVRTREGGLSRLLELLDGGEVELALVLLPTTDSALTTAPIVAEDLEAVLPTGHRLAAQAEIDLVELLAEPLIVLTTDFGLRQRVETDIALVTGAPTIAFESGDVGVIQGLVEAGFGVTIMPAMAIRRDLRLEHRPVRVNGERRQYQIGLGYRHDRYLSLAARAVFALARRVFAHRLGGNR